MHVGEAAILDQLQRLGEMRLGFGREAHDEVGPEHDVGPQSAQPPAKRERLGAAVPPLHALEDEVRARLQATGAGAA